MNTKMVPFNIELLIPDNVSLKFLRPIKVLDIFDGSTRNFHPEGLFSTEIFSKVGDERRNRLFAYIDLKAKVFHPIIYKALCDLKRLYGEIMSGSAYAVWDDKTKDFIKCSPAEGDTGYHYFLQHFGELQFEERPSPRREELIKLVNNERDNCQYSKLLVLPAGLRDFEIDESGKPSEDEVNTLYRKVFSIANLVTPSVLAVSPEALDNTCYSLQIAVNAIYAYFESLTDGKKKLVLGKWASRKIFNGTRNVITAMSNDIQSLNSPMAVSCNQTVVGLYQFLKAILPLACFHIKNGFLSQVFIGANAPVAMVDKKTLKKAIVHLDPLWFDEWMTDEGLEQIITRFGTEELRHMPLEAKGYYFGLIYKGTDNTFKIFQDIDELPVGFDKTLVTPLTFCELLYHSVYKFANDVPAFVTRYPITGYGSIYPSMTYLKTTVKGECRTELGEDWKPSGSMAIQFPIAGGQFVNSMSPNSTHLARLGADFDGDTCSYNAVLSDNAIAEVKQLLASRRYYVGPNGKLNFGAATDTVNYVLANMTA